MVTILDHTLPLIPDQTRPVIPEGGRSPRFSGECGMKLEPTYCKLGSFSKASLMSFPICLKQISKFSILSKNCFSVRSDASL